MGLSRRYRRKLWTLILSIFITGILLLAQRNGWIKQTTDKAGQLQPGQYKVLAVADGDTIEIDMNGTHERVRYIGVDTPETQDPRVAVQCFGGAASAFNKQLIGQSPVRLEADPTNTNRDRYNRLLRYVYLPDGRMVNAEIIKAGYGFAYTLFPFEKLEEFRNYERTAREQGVGLWGSCSVIESEGKKTTNPDVPSRAPEL